MGLGLNINSGSGGGGSFLPRMEYNAKAGRMKFSERVEVNGMWETQEQDVSFQQPAFVADMATIQVGWLMFKKGIPPVRALVTIGEEFPPCPVGDYGVDERGRAAKPKKGFVMRVLDSNRTVREFSSSASSVATAIDLLHDAYEAAPESKQGMLPVIQFTGAKEEKSNYGVNYAPTFAIIKWVPRPAELPAPGPVSAQSVATPIAQSAASLPPPTPQAVKPLPF